MSGDHHGATHPARRFGWREGVLLIGGRPVTALYRAAGNRPFYAYDAGIIRARVAELRRHLPNGVALHYAVKANGFAPVLGLMAGLVDGFDAASAGEIAALVAAGVAGARISFAGPGKGADEIAAAMAAGVRIVIEDPGELDDIAAARRRLGWERPVPLAVRINPPFALKRAGLRMGGEATAFGIAPGDLGALLARARALGLQIDGIHVFAGSQILDGAALAESHRRAALLVRELAQAHGLDPGWVNLGGGYGIPYVAGERPLDLAAAAKGLADARAILGGSGGSRHVAIELGRFLVGEAGVYVMRVLRVKTVHGRRILVTDGGLHHHLAATGNFGQVLHRAFPLALATRMPEGIAAGSDDGDGRESVTITGRLCSPLDVFARDVSLPPAGSGDLIAIFQSGAYGFEASPQAFLAHPPPRRLLLGR